MPVNSRIVVRMKSMPKTPVIDMSVRRLVLHFLLQHCLRINQPYLVELDGEVIFDSSEEREDDNGKMPVV